MRYSEEFKQQVVSRHQSGTPIAELCRQYGIARSTLFLLVREYSPDETGQIPRDIYLLQKEVERLRTENEIFRVCGCSAASPLQERFAAIDAHQDRFSLHALCRVLNVNRSAYYHHARYAPKVTQVQADDEAFKPLIQEIFEKSHGRFGARRIRAKLKQNGHTISERRITRLMKEMGLSSTGPHPRLNSANDRQYQYYPNKLKRRFLTDAPNAVWVSDITCAKVGMDFLYLCVVIDLYARKVVGYSISEYIDTALITDAFQRAYSSRGKPSCLTFHSDQGTQYTSYEFRTLLKRCGVSQSFSAPGNPYDNAVAESFFATIKKEDFRRNYYASEEEFRAAVDSYIEYYNDYRPHQRLGFLTPNQAEDEWFSTTAST